MTEPLALDETGEVLLVSAEAGELRVSTENETPRGVGDAHAQSQRQTRNAASYADRAMPPSVSVT